MGAMELVTKKNLMLFAGRGNEQLSKEIAEHLKVPLGEIVLSTFANGELYCRFGESIRGADVFILQSHCEPINERIMEQLLMLDAAKRASAKRITAVCPFYGYARQDRKAEGREPISARLLADCITVAGADRVVTVDLHTGQAQGFFDFPVDHLTAVPLLVEHLAQRLDGAVTVVTPTPRCDGPRVWMAGCTVAAVTPRNSTDSSPGSSNFVTKRAGPILSRFTSSRRTLTPSTASSDSRTRVSPMSSWAFGGLTSRGPMPSRWSASFDIWRSTPTRLCPKRKRQRESHFGARFSRCAIAASEGLLVKPVRIWVRFSISMAWRKLGASSAALRPILVCHTP